MYNDNDYKARFPSPKIIKLGFVLLRQTKRKKGKGREAKQNQVEKERFTILENYSNLRLEILWSIIVYYIDNLPEYLKN